MDPRYNVVWINLPNNEKIMFPTIEKIEDILPHIAGREEFYVKDHGNYKVVNYTFNSPDTFEDPSHPSHWYLRECRGLKFDKNGSVAARPFHKFFNLGEREYIRPDVLNWDNNVQYYQTKIDGSMVHPMIVDGKVEWMSKAGITHISAIVEEYLERTGLRERYNNLAITCHINDTTPLFEFTSLSNRIVVKYPLTSLTLLDIRRNITGEYLGPKESCLVSVMYNIPFVGVTHLQGFKQRQKIITDKMASIGTSGEGLVVTLNSGDKFKMKTPWYISVHRAKDDTLSEHKILKLIAEESMDDLYSLFEGETKNELEKYHRHISHSITTAATTIAAHVQLFTEQGLSRKEASSQILVLPVCLQQFAWNNFGTDPDPGDIAIAIAKFVARKCTSASSLADLRPLIGNRYHEVIASLGQQSYFDPQQKDNK